MDINTMPFAYGTPIPMAPPAPTAPHQDLRTATNLNGGRSSRVILPEGRQEKPRLTNDMLRALKSQGYTQGLAEALMKNKMAFPMAIWVVDNSGSMAHQDGHRLVESTKSNDLKFVTCSRWAEMQQTVDYHAQMAALIKNPTVFRLLNDPGRISGPQQFSIAERGEQYIDEELALAQQTMMNTEPGGVTPLVSHVQEIRENILALEPTLKADGTKVVLVLATDGLPSDSRGISSSFVKQEFEQALESLSGLPVWIVIRLCTDEEEVVKYWSELDSHLELE
jgi:Mg-chelatase subunit ChlD